MKTENTPTSASFQPLLEYAQEESHRWREWFRKNPQTLDVKIDIATAPDVRTLMLHIITVGLRYAEWLLGEPITPWQNISTESADSLFATGGSAFRKWRQLLETLSEEQWDEMMVFPKPMEGMKASRRKCFIHTIFHSTRHWAQLATALRSEGYPQDWQHDFIFTAALP